MAAVGVFMKFLRMVLDRVLQFPDHFWNGSPWCHTAMDTTLTLPSTKFLKIYIEHFNQILEGILARCKKVCTTYFLHFKL